MDRFQIIRYDEEDFNKFKCYSCKDKFSQPIIGFNDQEFLITARYKPVYLASKPASLDRKGEHMIPVFFVYESDELEKSVQSKKAFQLLDEEYRDTIFAITDSGSKSIHTLVYIDPSQQEKVGEDFKWYWAEVGKIIFGEGYSASLDKACASIGRLSRMPGGLRNGRILQRCLYKNHDCVGFDVSTLINKHRFVEYKRNVDRRKKLDFLRQQEHEGEDEDIKLERMYKANSATPAFRVFYEGLKLDSYPSGADYVGAIHSAVSRGFSEELITTFFERAKAAHPSNLPRDLDYYL